MKNEKIKYKQIALFIGILLGYLLFEGIYILCGLDYNTMSFDEKIMLSLIKYAFFMILLAIIYHKYLKIKWIDFKKNIKNYTSISFKYWFIGYLIMIASNLIINTFFKGLGQNEETVQNIISNTPIIAFIMTTFMAPFIEEMIFRKSLQDTFRNKTLFMVISGLIFGYLHVMSSLNPLEYLLIIPYGSLGFMFAKTLNETDNIY